MPGVDDDVKLGDGSLRGASVERLACLVRHWTWADEAMARFDRELADGWEYEEDLAADHPFGSYYHWCALLSGFCEAAITGGLMSPLQLTAIRPDLDASLAELRACREVLVSIPSSLERHPLVVDLLRDTQRFERLKRLHHAFGDALLRERASREIASLDE